MSKLSAADQSKQDAARETDGKFGNQLHGEAPGGTGVLSMPSASSAVLNVPASQVKVESYGDDLPEWPDDYPKPEVTWEFEDGKPKTRIRIGDEIWDLEANDDGLSRSALFNDSVFGDDYDALDAAKEWAEEVHKRIDEAVYSVSLQTAGSTGVSARILQFATTDNQGAPEPKTPISGPRFDAVVQELEKTLDETRGRLQQGYMLMAISEMQEQCPSVASFRLSADRHLDVTEIQDADGNDVSSEEADALYRIFRYREEADYSIYLGEEVDVQKIISTWQ